MRAMLSAFSAYAQIHPFALCFCCHMVNVAKAGFTFVNYNVLLFSDWYWINHGWQVWLLVDLLTSQIQKLASGSCYYIYEIVKISSFILHFFLTLFSSLINLQGMVQLSRGVLLSFFVTSHHIISFLSFLFSAFITF